MKEWTKLEPEHIEVKMTIEEFTSQIEEQVGWMRDSIAIPPVFTGDKDKDYDAVLDDIDANIYSDIYEVHVDYHLTNGEIIKTRNHCLESYYRKCYVGDKAYVYNGWLYVEFNSGDGIYHQSRVKPESVCWIDAYNVEVDWRANASLILRELKLE